MSGIFISYRREDSAGYTGRICAWLRAHVGDQQVFIDIDSIDPGENYVDIIRREISSAKLLLAVVGPRWMGVSHETENRLQESGDLVRAEVAAALSLGIRVVPVLVGGAIMPKRADLPPDLVGLASLQALEVSDKFFVESMDALARHLESWGIRRYQASDLSLPDPEAASEEPNPITSGPAGIKKKVCMLGAWGVGKTSLVRRFVDSIFSDSYLTTIGVRIDKKVVTIGSETLMLMLWDMAGEEEGAPLKISHLRDASAVVLVADGCRAGSLVTALKLRERIGMEIGPLTTVLAVNKVDLFDEWQVSMETLELHARTELLVFTTSAKTGKGVEQMFRQIARDLLFMKP